MTPSHLDRRFGLSAAGTSVRTEARAGVATFLAMAYIVVVNPSILADAGVPFEGALFATCIAAAIATLIMGVVANHPFALAPGMGLNAYFAYTVVLGMGVPWQSALGAVFISGVIFVLLTIGRVRAMVVDAIPSSIKVATAAGIGVFIAFVGLRNGGIVVANQGTLVALGDVASLEGLLFLAGLVAIGAMLARQRAGALVLGIVGVTVAAIVLGVAELPSGVAAWPDPGATFLQLDLGAAIGLGLLDIVFVFLFVDLFDTVGTLVGLADRTGAMDERGRIPRLNRAFLADSTGTVAGALLGTSTVTTYIESAAGVSEGGRTGLTAVFAAALFVAAAFFSPLVAAVPAIATAPALVVVGVLMIGAASRVPWSDPTDAVPAFLVLVGIPLTFSIANGLALGFISYPLVKTLAGRRAEVDLAAWILAALFVARYVYLGVG